MLDISVLLFALRGVDEDLFEEVKGCVGKVHPAVESRAAMFEFARRQPDIVLVDASGPRAEGLELIKALRRIDSSLVSAVVVDEGEALRRAVAVRADGYVVRPAAPGDMAKVLGECADSVRAQRAMKEHSRMTDVLLNGLPHPALLIERASQRVVLANEQARHLGFKMGEPCGDLFFPEGMDPYLAMESLYYKPVHIGMVRAAAREWDVTLAPATVSTVLLFAVDITERGRLERLRQDVERMVRHDLKTPLSGIIGMAQVLVEEGGLDGDNLHCAELIYANSEKMLRMIEESFNLIRMEEGVYVVKPEPFDFMAMLADVVAGLSRLAEAKSVRVLATRPQAGPGGRLTYLGEPLHLATCFTNLIKNAVEASPEGEEVSVEVRDSGDLEVEIRNIGAVPPEMRTTFFERYATSGKQGGMGIGTYSARLIARSHGGDVRFTTSESHGTRVLVVLPMAKQAA